MDEKKDIGKAFEERLSNNKIAPKNIVWENIVAELDKKKKKKKPLILWWKIWRIAAVILIIISIGYKLIPNKDQNIITITNDDIRNNKSKSTDYKVIDSAKLIVNKKNELIKNSTISKTKQNTQEETPNTTHHLFNNNSKVKTNQSIVNNSIFKPQKNNVNPEITTKNSIAKIIKKYGNEVTTTNQNKQLITKNDILEKISISALDSTKLNSNTIVNKHKKEDLDIQVTKINDESIQINNDKKTKKKWQISLKVAPIYYNSLTNGSSLDTNINTNSKNSEITLSYGLAASYTINQKIKIRTGLNKVNLTNRTNNIATNTILDSQTISISNISLFDNFLPLFPGENIININQEISYLEIPFELKYTVFNKKIGIDLISGFSTLILDDNSILINNVNLGSVNNLTKISFTGNFGLGLNYKLNKKINFNLEPLLKIQLNPYNSETDYKPYFFGVYSGFSYQF